MTPNQNSAEAGCTGLDVVSAVAGVPATAGSWESGTSCPPPVGAGSRYFRTGDGTAHAWAALIAYAPAPAWKIVSTQYSTAGAPASTTPLWMLVTIRSSLAVPMSTAS